MLQIGQSPLFGASAVRRVPRIAPEQVHAATDGRIAIEGATPGVSIDAKGRILRVDLVARLFPTVVVDVYAMLSLLVERV